MNSNILQWCHLTDYSFINFSWRQSKCESHPTPRGSKMGFCTTCGNCGNPSLICKNIGNKDDSPALNDTIVYDDRENLKMMQINDDIGSFCEWMCKFIICYCNKIVHSSIVCFHMCFYYIPTINTADFTPLFYYQIRPDRFHY